MSPHTRTILRDLGLLLHAPGLMALASLPVCLLFGEDYAVRPFLWTAVAALALGELLYRMFRRAEPTRLHQGMIVAALGWLVVPLLGAAPFLLVAWQLSGLPETAQTVREFARPENAFFEALSGFTGTGLSLALYPSELPRSLQWWRSLMEWVGGVGVIVLMLSLLRSSFGVQHLYYSEAREEKIGTSVVSTVRTIWWIYLLFTLLSIALLRSAGMPLWEAVNHGMTGIATGGFSVTDGSMAAYSVPIRLALVLVILAGMISFAVHYQVIRHGRLSALWKDTQHRTLWLLLGAGGLALLLENRWSSGSFLWVDTLFHWVSALGTAGFQSVNLALWSPTAKLLLSLAMIIGGAAGSTAGGLKLLRVALLHKGLMWRFRRIVRKPHQVMRYRLDGEALSETEADRLVEAAGVLAVLWATLLWAGILVLIHLVPAQFTLSDVIFEVASAQGNVGLSTGITHPELPWLGKLTLMASMWVGRLEIIPIAILVASLLTGARNLFKRPAPEP